jgi:hypothetical protein
MVGGPTLDNIIFWGLLTLVGLAANSQRADLSTPEVPSRRSLRSSGLAGRLSESAGRGKTADIAVHMETRISQCA